MEFNVRQARTEDAAAIAGLVNALARELGAKSSLMSAQKVEQDFINDNNGLCVHVGVSQGVVVAYALHHIAYESSQACKGRYLSDLYVARMARRRGVASALFARVAKITADEGGEFIWWIGKEVEGAARPFYTKISNINQNVKSYAVAQTHFENLVRSDSN